MTSRGQSSRAHLSPSLTLAATRSLAHHGSAEGSSPDSHPPTPIICVVAIGLLVLSHGLNECKYKLVIGNELTILPRNEITILLHIHQFELNVTKEATFPYTKDNYHPLKMFAGVYNCTKDNYHPQKVGQSLHLGSGSCMS